MEKLQQEIEMMVDQIAIPDQKLNAAVQDSLQKARRKRKRFSISKQNLIATFAAVFVLSFGVLLFQSSQEFTSGENTQSTMYSQGDEGLQRLVNEGKVQNLSLEAEDQGIKVLLQEGYLDNHQLAVSFQLDVESNVKLPEEASLSYEWVVNGNKLGGTSWGGIRTDDLLENGEILPFPDAENFPASSDFELRITNINEVEGDWSFRFHLDKQEEYIVKDDFPETTDALGNFFHVRKAVLTPSQLELKTNANLSVSKAESGYQLYEVAVIGIGEDDTRHLTGSMRMSSDRRPKVENLKNFYSSFEVPRGANVYSYEVIPYVATYQGEEVPVEHGVAHDFYKITVPFAEDEVLGSESPIKVQQIKQEAKATVVTYAMDPSIPEFPRIYNREADEMISAVSYKNSGNNYEVTYPKVNKNKNLEFLIYDVSYQLFPDLATKIELK
ncbi:DUF4179 domain-containing protein [Ornithinibacillus californiensis]|uniref:DUF4179 domain-containing protein n=1 Tax=Ornithinibacillus californiensis TaxID=161536 RepID=UPI00064DD0A8|nr:DUF4179 domain-containing protein [Ornithinibacillus californiensis]